MYVHTRTIVAKERLRHKGCEKFRTQYNKDLTTLKTQKLGQADDLDRYDALLNSVEKKKNSMYRKGGILRYEYFDFEEAKNYLEKVRRERAREAGKLENTPIFRGGGVMDVATKDTEVKVS